MTKGLGRGLAECLNFAGTQALTSLPYWYKSARTQNQSEVTFERRYNPIYAAGMSGAPIERGCVKPKKFERTTYDYPI